VVKRILRSAQTYFPWLQDFRFGLQIRLLRALALPYRKEYLGVCAFHVQNPLFIDIGANRGMSISTLRTMKPDARIVGFEPNYHLVEKMRRLFAGDADIRIEPFGLGDKQDQLTLYVPVYRGYRFDGLASIYKQNAEGWLNPDRILGFDPSKLVIEEMRVQIRTLDEYDFAPLLVKIYTQGYEQEIIRGAERTIKRYAPVILIPGHDEGTDALLRTFGYNRYSWVGDKFVREANRSFVVFYATAAHASEFSMG
jgi:FkbM family methyltransferase